MESAVPRHSALRTLSPVRVLFVPTYISRLLLAGVSERVQLCVCLNQEWIVSSLRVICGEWITVYESQHFRNICQWNFFPTSPVVQNTHLPALFLLSAT